jgi:glutathione S-transferase
MKRVLSATFCLWLSVATAFTTNPKVVKSEPRTSSYNADTALMATLYGHPGTRSPLVNWGAYEVGVELTMGDLSKNPHPFGQIPCLTDDDDVLVFESGAILHYLHDKTKESLNKADAALVTSWITWANASLDPICFLETPDGKVYDTGLKQPNKRIDQLNNMLEKQSFLIGDQFSLADVAVASYLLYVLQFFRDTDLSRWPNIVRYMKDCASRPAYGQAFGENVQANMVDQLESDPEKKLFGMF